MPNFNLKDLMISLPDAADQIPQTLCHGTQPCLPTLCHGTKPCLPTFCLIPTVICRLPTNYDPTICRIPTHCFFSPHPPFECKYSPIPIDCTGTITPVIQYDNTPIEIDKADIKTLGLLKEKLASSLKKVEAQISASSKAKKG